MPSCNRQLQRLIGRGSWKRHGSRGAPKWICCSLDTDLVIAVTNGFPADSNLTSQEERALVRISQMRRPSWLAGRQALKILLRRLGRTTDTARITFPNRSYSLTHSGDYAVALGTASTDYLGVGADLEIGRTPDSRTARFFLTAYEQLWLTGLRAQMRPRNLLRLWTVKEALFKSYPHNDSTVLTDYALLDPGAESGIAIIAAGESVNFQYRSSSFLNGWLSIAVCRGRDAYAS